MANVLSQTKWHGTVVLLFHLQNWTDSNSKCFGQGIVTWRKRGQYFWGAVTCGDQESDSSSATSSKASRVCGGQYEHHDAVHVLFLQLLVLQLGHIPYRIPLHSSSPGRLLLVGPMLYDRQIFSAIFLPPSSPNGVKRCRVRLYGNTPTDTGS